MKMIKLSNLLGDRIYQMKEKRSRRRKIAQREFEEACENANNIAKEFSKIGISKDKK